MIVTAMLAWFNEEPATLHRAITSLHTIADHVIAIDGGWDLYPGAQPSSPPEQAAAINHAATSIGIHADIRTGQTWTSQIAKRNHMLQLAHNADWVLPLDADWELQGDRTLTRTQLATTPADALIVPFHTPANPDANLDDVAATQWHKNQAGTTDHQPLIYRNLEDIRVEDHHWYYSGIRDGQRVALWGCESRYPQAHTATLNAPFRIVHHCLYRNQATIQANREYCQQRDKHVREHGTEPS